jgi:predicted nucleic acid-binding protein
VNVVADTSVWIDFFRSKPHAAFEDALREARVFATPVILAELVSGESKPSRERALLDLFFTLPFVPTPVEHWIAVGRMRCHLAGKGVSISTPDAHVAQAALDAKAVLLTRDRIFTKIAPLIGLSCQN